MVCLRGDRGIDSLIGTVDIWDSFFGDELKFLISSSVTLPLGPEPDIPEKSSMPNSLANLLALGVIICFVDVFWIEIFFEAELESDLFSYIFSSTTSEFSTDKSGK